MKKVTLKVCELHSGKDVRKIATDPIAVCVRCGAKAHNPLNLCDPAALFDVSS